MKILQNQFVILFFTYGQWMNRVWVVLVLLKSPLRISTYPKGY
uniref:Ycf2 n=1 Tax=Pinus morrisonicola TaxID=139307 RepID=A0A346PZZ8_9CONI|nr:ycf2 [Pinus morrisonicola]AXR86324.1 ycf2 [Pinus morrisonicola]